MLSAPDGDNINGPSCIEVPEWVENRLGRYYLYFAHHRGDHIRLAYADRLTGPWTVFDGGVLRRVDLTHACDHIASPDVVIDAQARQIRMYFHGGIPGNSQQLTYLACSANGIDFTASPDPIAPFYLRVVPWRNQWIGMSKGGALSISGDGKSRFTPLARPAFPMSSPQADMPGDVRHVALDLEGDRLWVMFSRIGEAPEHIRLGYIDLLRAQDQWQVDRDVPLLKPELEWEGADIPSVPSRAGPANEAENALRDPAILRTDGKAWLFYAFAAERGIALTALPDLGNAYLKTPEKNAQAAISKQRKLHQSIQQTLNQLKEPGALARTLAGLDRQQARKRIYLMGCGRSGTWLLTSLMACFDDIKILAKELPIEIFGLVLTHEATIMLKRSWNAYLRLDAIPDSVYLLHIIRHPFDVLTSHNPTTNRKYHISPERWLGEMTALKQLVDSKRERVLIIAYEDMVIEPERILTRIASSFGLVATRPPHDALNQTKLPPEAIQAMHGRRPINRDSVERYRRDPEAIAYLATIIPGLRGMLTWVEQEFGYDISLT